MGLKCGIVGLPNVGKSTLFNALTNAGALAANYPFATKEPNIGVITVPDPRLDKLVAIANPRNVVPATVDIVDIAGLIKGASKGEGLGNQFLANIREVNAIIHVIRCFDNPNVVHVDGSVHPQRDKEVIDIELILKDCETVEKRLDKLKKQAKSAAKEDIRMAEIAADLLKHLEQGYPARSFDAPPGSEELFKDLMLLSAKPVLYLCNVDVESVITGNKYSDAVKEMIAQEKAEVILLSADIEAEIAQVETYDDKMLFLSEMKLNEPGVNRLIHSAYQLLNLITYFTVGEKEVRAWTVPRNTAAPQAAGVIHSDFEKGFIRAEVMSYNDFVTMGSEAAVKEAGKLVIAGKDYIVQDGDIMHFRFNV